MCIMRRIKINANGSPTWSAVLATLGTIAATRTIVPLRALRCAMLNKLIEFYTIMFQLGTAGMVNPSQLV